MNPRSKILTPTKKIWTPRWDQIQNGARHYGEGHEPIRAIGGGVPPTVYGTFVTKVGISVEATPGTAPGVSPSRVLPTLKPVVKDAINWYADQSFRGIAAKTFGHYQLQGTGAVDLAGPFYPDASGYSFLGAYGQDIVTAAPSATTTTGTNNAGSSSLTITSGTGYVNGAAILIGAGATQEGNLIISGGGTTTLTLAGPLRFTQNAGTAVTGNTMHQLAMNAATTPPKTFTIWDYYGVDWRQYTFSSVSDVAFEWAASTEATYTAKHLSWLSTIPTTPTPPAYSTVAPFMGWQSGFLLAGGVQTNLEQFEYTAKRTLVPVPGPTNSQNPASIFAAELAVTGSAVLQMASETEYNQFRNALNPIIKFALFGPAVGVAGAQTASGMLFQSSQTAVTLGQIIRTKEYVQVSLTFECDYNVTDVGPSTIFLTNAYTAYS